jgi:flagellar biosynthesis chaperone FliJ
VSQSIFKLERLLRVRRLEESAAKLAVDGEVARHRACVAQVEASLRMARDAAVARNNRLGQKAVDAAQWRESEAEAGLLRSIATIEAGRLIELERGVAESRQTYLARRRQKQQAETLRDQALAARRMEQQRRHGALLDDLHRMRQRRGTVELFGGDSAHAADAAS